MTIEEIIDGLRFTVSMFLFDPMTGETKMPSDLSEDDKTTVDACMEAKKILKRYRWIPTMERMPEEDETVLVCRKNGYMHTARYEFDCWNYCNHDINIEDVIAWMPLPEPYKEANYE